MPFQGDIDHSGPARIGRGQLGPGALETHLLEEGHRSLSAIGPKACEKRAGADAGNGDKVLDRDLAPGMGTEETEEDRAVATLIAAGSTAGIRFVE